MSWQAPLFAGLFALLLRGIVGLGPYSGMGKPPMHGDFEAQRHWMEITSNLPRSEWYAGQHVDNNLQYWGLDYPPLTAYHSFVLGKALAWVCPEAVELGASRGIETFRVKTWMRFFALLSDALVFLPSVLLFAYWHRRQQEQRYLGFLLLVLTSPSLILIDHGHFQFNCVCHGLVVFALALAVSKPGELTRVQAILICISFSLALNFKQMALYYALAFFIYLLRWSASASSWSESLLRLLVLATTVIATFALVWSPLFFDNATAAAAPPDVAALQILRRIFPFERGIFEDKVANFWGVGNTMIKWKLQFTARGLQLLSLSLTLASTLPALYLLWRERMDVLQAAFCTSLAFFLFSFQVHEKSILLPLIPALLLLYQKPGSDNAGFALAFSLAASFSLIPLFAKDGIAFTAFASQALHLLLGLELLPLTQWQSRGVLLLCAMFTVTSLLVLLVDSPVRALPDLFIVLHNAYAFAVFMGFFLLAHYLPFRTNDEGLDKEKKE